MERAFDEAILPVEITDLIFSFVPQVLSEQLYQPPILKWKRTLALVCRYYGVFFPPFFPLFTKKTAEIRKDITNECALQFLPDQKFRLTFAHEIVFYYDGYFDTDISSMVVKGGFHSNTDKKGSVLLSLELFFARWALHSNYGEGGIYLDDGLPARDIDFPFPLVLRLSDLGTAISLGKREGESKDWEEMRTFLLANAKDSTNLFPDEWIERLKLRRRRCLRIPEMK